jgi:sterol desaturase/sphingolipid hydroxylase (fatty acid hydroxylase superfamily)
MHLKALYNAHRFHHRFNTHVAPSTANAVSFSEYALAYMLPFIVGCLVLRPDGVALFAAVSVISLNNLLIHTPALEAASRWLPALFVSTADHLDHHRRLTTNYVRAAEPEPIAYPSPPRPASQSEHETN